MANRWSVDDIDWSKIPIDTPILVRNDQNSEWRHVHFAKYEDGKIFAFNMGCTSWTVDENIPPRITTPSTVYFGRSLYEKTNCWEYAKLSSSEKWSKISCE